MNRDGWSVAALFFLAACSSRIVELDHTSPADPRISDDSSLLSDRGFLGVWVDERRLYWLLGDWTFQSCLKEDCAHTQQTYTTNNKTPINPAVDANYVYWNAETSTELLSCSVEGCEPKPSSVTRDPDSLYSIYAHDGYVYWSSEFDIYRCRASGCTGAPEVVATGSTASSMVFDEKRAYWIDTGSAQIMSAPVNGSEPSPKVFAPPLGVSSSLAVGDGYLYSSLIHGIYRCLVADCHNPTLMIMNGAFITSIKLDGSTLYWLETSSFYSCQLPDCAQPTLVTPKNVAPADSRREAPRFAMDATDIYWIEARDRDSNQVPSIRRTAKQ
jgi:hypothetical protein